MQIKSSMHTELIKLLNNQAGSVNMIRLKGISSESLKYKINHTNIIKKTDPPQNNLKGSNELNYTPGDRILFNCISGNHSTIISDTPTTSITDTVVFYDCTDVDSNNYAIVTIGTQVWMAENLKVTRYRNGDTIPEVANDSVWTNIISGAYCNYNNDVNNVTEYGRLYNGYVVSDIRNICPTGWHVPDDAEWSELAVNLDGSAVAGGKMKEAGTTHWYANIGADNSSGFTGRPGGERNDFDASWFGFGYYGYWWSSQNSGYYLNYDLIDLGTSSFNDKWGLSVRCIID